jgi:hypothetical protein
MENGFNIFECLADGSVRWCEEASSLIKARRLVRELVRTRKSEFFAMQLPTRAIIFHSEAPALGRRVFQIAYTERLCHERAHLLRTLGYGVLSVIGSEAAKRLLRTVHIRPADIDLFMVGHAAPEAEREETVAWLKARYPLVRVLALNPPDTRIPGADHNVPLNGPEVWLPLLPPHKASPTSAHEELER